MPKYKSGKIKNNVPHFISFSCSKTQLWEDACSFAFLVNKPQHPILGETGGKLKVKRFFNKRYLSCRNFHAF